MPRRSRAGRASSTAASSAPSSTRSWPGLWSPGQLGRDGPHEHRLPQARDGRPGDPRRGLDHRRSRRRIQVTAGRIVDAATGVELATAEATYVAASEPASASSRSATATLARGAKVVPRMSPAPPARDLRRSLPPPTAFVAAHLARATALGERLADLVGSTRTPSSPPSSKASRISRIRSTPTASRSVAPGLGLVLGVRLPLMEAAHKPSSAAPERGFDLHILDVDGPPAAGQEPRDVRWFGMWNLERLLPTDPERTWQLMRRAARGSGGVDHVDTLAHPYGAGILRDAAPLGGTRAARLLAVALGAAARRLHPGHDAAREARRLARRIGGQERADPHRPAHRRQRA
jgi:hypothetical protein